MMQCTIAMPDDIAERWQTRGNAPREVLEGVALEAYQRWIIEELRLQQW